MALTGETPRGLAAEQAALRRVAMLVADGVPPEETFAVVTKEAGTLLGADLAAMARYEGDGMVTTLSTWAADGEHPEVEGTVRLKDGDLATRVLRTGRPARTDGNYCIPHADVREQLGIRSSVAGPIVVAGQIWGGLVVHSQQPEPLAAETESRLMQFAELVATAVANAHSRGELARFVEQEAALRRVATLVARGTPPEELFAAVVDEVGELLPIESASMCRYESDESLTFVATWGKGVEPFPVGSRQRLGGKNLGTIVFETGRSARLDRYADAASGPLGAGVTKADIRSSVATPITVEGQLWGVIAAGSVREQPLPPDTEARLASFTELVATAIANAESRGELAQLAVEQAALRRVATLVARGAPQEEVFAAVAEEVGRLLPVFNASMVRYEPDDTVTAVAAWGIAETGFPVGSRWSPGGENLITIVLKSGRPARMDDYSDASGPIAAATHAMGVRSAVASPILVEGRLWGAIVAGSNLDQPLPADTESRLASFTELVATAVANAESRAEVAASRGRIVAAADESRRRIERDLHDGAQQRLVHAVIVLKLVLQALANAEDGVSELVVEALGHAEQANAELRELAHGILPAALTRGGLKAGVEAVVSRVSLPVRMDVSVPRLPAGLEATAYFVVSEALTNVVKHASAAEAAVTARVRDGELRIEVRDDGVGGARGGHTTGLGGLEDRVSALDGRLVVESPPGRGTCVCAILPVPDGG